MDQNNPPQTPRRRRRRLVLALLGLPLLLVLAVVLLLESKPVRGWLVGRVDQVLQRSSGVGLTADDFDLSWSGRLVVHQPALAAGGSPPFFRAEKVEAAWRWSDLRRGGVWQLEEARVDRPRLDLEAPLPEGQGGSSEDSQTKLPLTIRTLRVQEGAVLAQELVDRGWLSGFKVHGLQTHGTLLHGELDLEGIEATVDLLRRDVEATIPLEVDAKVRGPVSGPWQVDDFQVRGEGLSLDLQGKVEKAARRLPIRFEMRLEPALLLPDLVPDAGVVQARGDLELRRPEGQVHLDVQHFPPEILEPWIPEDIYARLDPADTFLEAQADLEVNGWTVGEVTGQATAFWSGPDEPLLRAEVHLPENAEELLARFQIDLLPAEEGRRHLAGEVIWPDGSDPQAGVLRNTRFELEEANLPRSFEQWRQRWPKLLPELPAPLPPHRLGATADLSGPWLDPRADLRLDLGPTSQPILHLEADGWPKTLRGKGRLEATGFDLASLGMAGLAGELEAALQGSWNKSGTSAPRVGGRFQIQNLHLNESLPMLEVLDLEAELRGTEVSSLVFHGRAEDLEFQGTGSAVLENPLRRGWLEIQAQQPSQGLRHLDTHLELTNGVLHIHRTNFETRAGDGNLSAVLPLASLARQPDLRRALADLPVTRAPGPANLQLQVQQLETDTLAQWLGQTPPGASFSGDLSLIFDFDPADPRQAQGSFEVGPANLHLADVQGQPLTVDLKEEGTGGRLQDGRVELMAQVQHERLGAVDIQARAPFARLLQALDGAGRLPAWAEGQELLEARVRWTGFDSQTVSEVLAPEAALPQWSGNLDLELSTNPDDLPSAQARLTVDSFRFEISEQQSFLAEEPVLIHWSAPWFQLEPLELHTSITGAEERLRLRGGARLEGLPTTLSNLRGENAPKLAELRFQADGEVPAQLVDPWLAGGRAQGAARVNIQVEGPPEALDAQAQLSGPDLRLLFLSPYSSELRAPECQFRGTGGEWTLESCTAELNEGRLDAIGRFSLTDGVHLEGFLDRSRYRLDYGLNVLLSGNFDLRWPFESDSKRRLGANILVERGILRRDIDVDRRVLEIFSRPPQIPGVSAEDPLDLELDLSIGTVDGVRIRNNVADLHATWNPITVTGSLSQPVIEGGVDLEPGGLLFTFGQTVRVDRGSLTFPGIPGVAPEVDLETTSTLEDRTVGLRTGDPFGPTNALPPVDVGTALTTGLMTHYGDRIAGLLGQPLGRTQISFRPLAIFGETDLDPHLTISRDLSPQLSFAVAASLQGDQRRTYLVDLHDLRFLPGVTTQVFTNDQDNAGVTGLKTFEFGGGPEEDDRPRLAEVDLECPPVLSCRALRRALPFSPGDALPEDPELEMELDLRDDLARKGYPDARVTVRGEGAGEQGDLVRLQVSIDPGPHAEIVFSGDRPPRNLRRSIANLYVPGFGEIAAQEEMRRRAEEVFRGLGHPHPNVEVRTEPKSPREEEDRQVLVHVEAGERWEPEPPLFLGIPDDIAPILQGQFLSTLERVELALGTPAADARLLAALRRLGWTEARLLDREVDEAGATTVTLESGPRRHLASLEIEGWPEDEPRQFEDRLTLAVGDACRLDSVAEAAVLLEGDLRRRGYARARVRPVLSAAAGQENLMNLVLQVTPGERLQVAEVRGQGQRKTKESWIRRVADLEPGAPLRTRDLAEARRRLLRTGVFSRVQVRSEPQAVSDPSSEAIPARVLFDLEENPRFSVSAGLRWASSEGLGAVVDVLDRNVLGRGATVGLRFRASNDQARSVRLYSVVPRLLASANDLELFAQARRRETLVNEIDTFDLTFQLKRSWGTQWQRNIYGRYRREERNPLAGGAGTVRDRPLLGFQLIYGQQQVAEFEPRGLFASLDLSGADPALGGDQRALRIYGQVNTYRPFEFLGRRWVWGQSFRLGWADAFGDPLRGDLRFRAGGELSVRGYRTNTLGLPATVEDLEEEGGEALLILNQELRFPLYQDLQGVLFFDLGKVDGDLDDLLESPFRSVGLGVRASTPIGLLRLDVAVPLDRRDQDEAAKIYVGFGNIF